MKINKKKKQYSITFILLAVMFSGCGDRDTPETDLPVIDVASVFGTTTELKLSDYFADIRFVPLETPEEALVNRRVVWQLTDRYLLATGKDGCLLFERETGRFLCSVGHVGNDPEGYFDGYGIPDEANDRILFKGWKNDLILYNFVGEYTGKIDRPTMIEAQNSLFTAYLPLGKESIAGHFCDFTGKQDFRFTVFDTKGDSITAIPDTRPYEFFEIDAISVFNQFPEPDMDLGELLHVQGCIDFTGKEQERLAIWVGMTPFWQYEGKSWFKEQYNDTIYRIKNNNLVPDRLLSLDKHTWPYEERYVADKMGKRISVIRMMEGENLLLFRFIVGLYSEELKYYNGIYHKPTGKVKINDLSAGITDDLLLFLSLNPVAVSPDGTMMAVIPADRITEWIEEEGKQNLPSALSHLANIREDDNPVIVLMK